MFFSNPVPSYSDSIWSKHDPTFATKMEYPFPEILTSPEECVQAMDWIVEKAIAAYDDSSIPVNKWYDFIWTKTWSIRKRILQLHLDDLDGVGILERCTRFHIFCAHAFAEISEPLFVAQFNFEHIGKCLINLKYLYHDLNSRGIFCANEAEFLCYYLLHFPKSYRDMIDFPLAVRKSKNIQFALKFLEAENTNNFIAFFKLIKQATYMQGCLLHRYFMPMRERALRAMCKAYKPSQSHDAKITVNEFNSLLDFEDDQERENYLQCAGIGYDFKNVIFTKSFIEANPFKPEIRSSHKVIERLREYKDLRQVITGKEGSMLTNELQRIFPPPKINCNKEEITSAKVEKKIRVAESILRSLILHTVNIMITESIEKLRFPNGKPEYEYDDQSSLGSIVSELDGTRNESFGEIVFEGNVVKESSQEEVSELQHESRKETEPEEEATMSVSVAEPVLVESSNPESTEVLENEHEPTSAPAPTPEPDQDPESTTVPVPTSDPESESELEPEIEEKKLPELKTFSASKLIKARMSASRFMRMYREKEKQQLDLAEARESAKSSTQLEPTPESPAAVQETKDEIVISQDGAQADQGLEDSALIVSDVDEDEEPITSQNVTSNVLASLIRAVAKYHDEHGVGSLNAWK